MESSSKNKIERNITRLCFLSTAESNSKNVTASSVPPTIKGILFPIFVSALSDSVPNKKKKKIASTLSIAISAPVTVSPR